jgi:hypothetical protein
MTASQWKRRHHMESQQLPPLHQPLESSLKGKERRALAWEYKPSGMEWLVCNGFQLLHTKYKE